MSIRELKNVETFVRGKWIKTKGFFTSSEICRYPPCIRKIPSKRSRKRTSDAKIPNGYCCVACKQKHTRKEHLIDKLDDFIYERKD